MSLPKLSITAPELCSSAQFEYLPLSNDGLRILKTIVEIKFSTKYSKEENFLEKILNIFFRSIESCMDSETETIRYELSPVFDESELIQLIERDKRNSPKLFRVLSGTKIHEGVQPSYCNEFLSQLTEFINSNNLERLNLAVTEKVTCAFFHALKAHSENPSKIFFVSSKSDYFRDINSDVEHLNAKKALDHPHEFVSLTKASLRVLDSKCASITLPFQKRFMGGNRIINTEILVKRENENFNLSVFVRCKVQKKYRHTSTYDCFVANIDRIADLKDPLFMIPEIAFSTPNKGDEFLCERYDGDLFSMLENYKRFATSNCCVDSPQIQQLQDEDVLKSAQKMLRVMIDISLGVKAMHDKDFLHNDLKPENILIKNLEDKKIQIKISDFDFMTTFVEGELQDSPMGTPGYFNPLILEKTPHSDLFALARTFYMDDLSYRDSKPSFMDFFLSLHKLFPKETKLAKFIPSLERLTEEMQTGYIFVDKQPKPITANYVVRKLMEMERILNT